MYNVMFKFAIFSKNENLNKKKLNAWILYCYFIVIYIKIYMFIWNYNTLHGGSLGYKHKQDCGHFRKIHIPVWTTKVYLYNVSI